MKAITDRALLLLRLFCGTVAQIFCFQIQHLSSHGCRLYSTAVALTAEDGSVTKHFVYSLHSS